MYVLQAECVAPAEVLCRPLAHQLIGQLGHPGTRPLPQLRQLALGIGLAA